MIPHVEDCYFYSRENNTIIANLTDGGKIPLVRLHQNFIDVTVLGGEPFEYMKRYMAMNPHLWEHIKEEPKTNEQLKLFRIMSKLQFGSLLTADLKEDTITFEMEESISIQAGDYAIIKCDTITERMEIEEFFEKLKNK